MKIHELTGPPAPWLGAALEQFEAAFRYPLGPAQSFVIEHGRDYVTFFQAMGEAHVFVAERAGAVLGTLTAVIRPVRLPGGDIQPAAYLCDLKVTETARGGRTLPLLMKVVRDRLEARCGGVAYVVVMGGTERTPIHYTGRRDVPAFKQLGEIVVLRIPTPPLAASREGEVLEGEAELAEEIHCRLIRGSFVPLAGSPALRSEMAPLHLRLADGNACGILEDTRRGKRLFDQTGGEMLSAHFSRFAYAGVVDGTRIVRCALRLARQRGFPALFTALPRGEADELVRQLGVPDIVIAPAIVFGCGFADNAPWRIDTAEI